MSDSTKQKLTTDTIKVLECEVTVIEADKKQIFFTVTDADWKEFYNQACGRMDTPGPGDQHIGYWISTESHQWELLVSEIEWKDAMKPLAM